MKNGYVWSLVIELDDRIERCGMNQIDENLVAQYNDLRPLYIVFQCLDAYMIVRDEKGMDTWTSFLVLLCNWPA